MHSSTRLTSKTTIAGSRWHTKTISEQVKLCNHLILFATARVNSQPIPAADEMVNQPTKR